MFYLDDVLSTRFNRHFHAIVILLTINLRTNKLLLAVVYYGSMQSFFLILHVMHACYYTPCGKISEDIRLLQMMF